jgi:hypothetical protein
MARERSPMTVDTVTARPELWLDVRESAAPPEERDEGKPCQSGFGRESMVVLTVVLLSLMIGGTVTFTVAIAS